MYWILEGFLWFYLPSSLLNNLLKVKLQMISPFSVGAVIGDGQSAVASNIANTTYRLQWWDFTKFDLPEISNGKLERTPVISVKPIPTRATISPRIFQR